MKCPSCGHEDVSEGERFCPGCGRLLLAPSASVTNKIIDYRDLVTRSTTGFVGRQWVRDAVDSFLGAEGPRDFLLLGEPGSGKTTFMADLIQRRGYPHHFIGKGSLSGLATSHDWRDPIRFAESLGYQLVRDYGGWIIDWESWGIQVEQEIVQQVRDLQGLLIGSAVKDFEAVPRPAGRPVITVQQEVEQFGLAARVVGVYIENFEIRPEQVVRQLLTMPLTRIAQRWPDHQVVLVIDGLDEAEGYSDSQRNILHLLPNGTLPANVRFLLSSRPGAHLSQDFLQQVHPFWLSEDEVGEQHPGAIEDAKNYVVQLAGEETIQPMLEGRKLESELLGDRVAQASRGNFLYLYHYAQGLRDGDETLLDLNALPQGLLGIYEDFFTKIKEKREDVSWDKAYKPVLGILAVAIEPLTQEQIAAMSNVKRNTVATILGRLVQFLNKAGRGKGRRYAIYHNSFGEYVISEENEDYIDPREANALIIAHVRGESRSWADVDWSQIDDYGLYYLAAHLYALSAQEPYRSELHRFLCLPVLREKQRRTGAHLAFSRDVSLALSAAREAEPPDLVGVVRAGWLYATLIGISAEIWPNLLGLLARVGRADMALGYANVLPTSWLKGWAYQSIGENLPESDERRITVSMAAARIAIAIVPADLVATDGGTTDQIAVSSDIIRDSLKTMLGAKAYAQALELAERIQREDYLLAALEQIAHALVRAPANEFRHEFASQGWARIETMQKEQVSASLAWEPVMVRAGQARLALADLPADAYLDSRILDIAMAFVQRGESQLALEAVEHLQEPGKRSSALCELVLILQTAGAMAPARSAARSALAAAQAMPDGLEKLKNVLAASLSLAHAGEIAEATAAAEQAPGTAGTDRPLCLHLREVREALLPLLQSGFPELVEIAYHHLDQLVAERLEMYVFNEHFANEVGYAAQDLAQAGHSHLARQLCEQILPALEEPSPPAQGIQHIRGLAHIAVLLSEMGEDEIATDTIDLIIQIPKYRFFSEHDEIAKGLAMMKQYDRSLEIIADIRGFMGQMFALDQVAEIAIQSGDLGQGRRIADRIIAEANACAEDRYRQLGLCNAVKRLLQCGADERAWTVLQIALSIPENDVWYKMIETGNEMAEAGKIELAEQLAELMVVAAEAKSIERDVLSKGFALTCLSETLAQTGALDQAMTVIRHIDGGLCQALAYRQVGQVLVQAGKSHRALRPASLVQEAAESSANRLSQILGLALAVGAYRRAGAPARAGELFEPMAQQLSALLQEESQPQMLSATLSKRSILETFCHYLERQGALVQAELLRLVIGIDPRLVAPALAVALVFLLAGEVESAATFFDAFLKVYPELPENMLSTLKANGVDYLLDGWVALLNCQLGAREEAQEWARHISKDPTPLEGLGFAPAIVGLAAQVLDLAGDHAQAASLLSQVTEEPLRSALNIERLSAQAQNGQTEEAHALAVQVANEIVTMAKPGTQVIAASRLTPVLLQMGKRELAKKVALQTGATLKAELDNLGEYERIQALSAAASSLGRLGLLSQAQSFYVQAFDGARPLGRAEVCSIVAMSADWIDPDQARGTIRALEEIDSWWKAAPYV